MLFHYVFITCEGRFTFVFIHDLLLNHPVRCVLPLHQLDPRPRTPTDFCYMDTILTYCHGAKVQSNRCVWHLKHFVLTYLLTYLQSQIACLWPTGKDACILCKFCQTKGTASWSWKTSMQDRPQKEEQSSVKLSSLLEEWHCMVWPPFAECRILSGQWRPQMEWHSSMEFGMYACAPITRRMCDRMTTSHIASLPVPVHHHLPCSMHVCCAHPFHNNLTSVYLFTDCRDVIVGGVALTFI
jgi:hypothetical protein